MAQETANKGYSIGDLAKRAACRVETVRYYEREGLIPDPPRSEGGHRIYDADAMKRLTFIRRARELGFTVEQVRSLLGLADSGSYTCAEVRALTLKHRAEVREKLVDLKKLDAVLTDLARECEGQGGQDCAILDALYGPSTGLSR